MSNHTSIADSYGYRPGKSALDAVGVTRQRCWRRDWVIDLDIKGFFDNLDWDLVMRAVRHHTDVPWILLYVERWLRAPVQHADGRLEERTKGSPQGSVISPLLSNLFMHYAFDEWLRRNFPTIQFATYADDAVVHARSRTEAERLLAALRQRLAECGLELHPEKTKIVYCKDDDRRGTHEHTSFDFLGYTFRPRRAKNRWGKLFISFLPGVSNKAAKSIRATIRSWRLGATRNNQSLEEIAKFVNPFVRGWVNYYGRFYKSALTPVLRSLERSLVYWVRRKFKRFRSPSATEPFTGWAVWPARTSACSCCGKLEFDLRLDNKSRMSREVHVRFCEGLGVRFPRATRLVIGFRDERDARRVMEVMPKRFGKYGLTIHPTKTNSFDSLRVTVETDA